MSYPEQQMQNHIEAGLSEADRCYSRIAELEAERDALAVEVNALTYDRDVFASRLEDAEDQVSDLHTKNSALAAQVEARDALLRNISSWISKLPVPTKSATSYMIRIDGVIKETPAACLAQVKADAGRAGFIACIKMAYELQHPPGTAHADQCAERILKEVV